MVLCFIKKSLKFLCGYTLQKETFDYFSIKDKYRHVQKNENWNKQHIHNENTLAVPCGII
jgi:hypothetical protein